MQKSYQLIELYCAVCHHYDSALVSYAQRTSNNFCPKFSDEECIATLISGIANQKYDVKRCYEFIEDYYSGWFPKLPSYQTYNKRICFLANAFRELAGILLSGLGLDSNHADFVYDSMPIVVANSARSVRAKVASEFCNKGYCASKKCGTIVQSSIFWLSAITKLSQHPLKCKFPRHQSMTVKLQRKCF